MRPSTVATLIADLVESRSAPDRQALHARLRQSLERVRSDDTFEWQQYPELTVGDEFQAVLPDLRSAVAASLWLRLTILSECGVDTRYGIGWGPIEILEVSASPIRQDGPGWWSAREAIDESKLISTRKQYSFLRTRVASESGDDSRGGEVAALNAYAAVCDEVIDSMKKPARRYLLRFLEGVSQEVIAKEEKVTQSNVSQTLASSGAHAIKRAQLELLNRVRS